MMSLRFPKYSLMSTFVLLSVILTSTLVMGRIIPCLTDADCKYDKCCVLQFTGQGRVCRGIPEHIGDPCGGDYFCPTCSYNLVCTPIVRPTPQVDTVTNDTVAATITNDTTTPATPTCPPPVNSTCQLPAQLSPAAPQPPSGQEL